MRSSSMRLPIVVSSSCLPLTLLASCPGDDTGDEGAAETTTHGDTTAAGGTSTTSQTEPTSLETNTTQPPETDTNTTQSPETDTNTTQPPDTETNTAPPDTDTETDTNGQPAGCECILDEDHVQSTETPAAPTCGESLCPTVAGDCGEDRCGGGGSFVLEDPAALECALTALRDRSPGIVGWTWFELIGLNDDAGYVLVNEDGTAVRRRWGWDDLGYEAGDAVLGELPPPEHFDACLAEPDDLARFDCLRGTLDTMLGVCDEGWIYSKV